MTRTSLARILGFALFILLNLAIYATPSSAGWRDYSCATPDGERVKCCTYCLLCWGCDEDVRGPVEEVE